MVEYDKAWPPQGKHFANPDDYDSLRSAYEDRVRNLAKRLKNTCQSLQGTSPGHAHVVDESAISGPGSPYQMGALSQDKALQRKMKDIVDGEVSHERESQINVLADKVGHLLRDRQNLLKELDAVPQRYKDVLRDLKQQLSSAQQRHNDMRMDFAQLSQQIQDEERHHYKEKEFLDRSGEDSVANFQGEIKKLQSVRHQLDNEFVAAQSELRDYHQRVESLYQERAQAQEEEVSIAMNTKAAKEELQGVRQCLSQSEAERNELLDRYQSVGQKFERAMDMSEKENMQVIKHLQHKMQKGKHKADKYHRKLEKSQSTLTAAQASVKLQFSAIQDKENEIKRLHQLCEDERKSASKKEAQFYEAQRQALQDQSLELQKFGDMMPVAAHQQILADQGQYYRSCIKELEDNLKTQIRETERDAKEREERAFKEYQEKVEKCKAGAKDLDVVQDEASIRCQRLEEELKEVRASLTQSEVNIAEVEEQRKTFMNSLEVATVRLGNLRGVLEEEKKAKEIALQEAQDLARHTGEISKDIATREAKLQSQLFGKQLDCEDLKKQIEDSLRRITDAESAWEEFKDKSRKCQEELLSLGAERKSYEQRLRDADSRASLLEKVCAREQVALRKRQEAIFRIRCCLEGHVDFSRQELAQLRSRFRDEQKVLFSFMGNHAQAWIAGRAPQKTPEILAVEDEELRSKRAESAELKLRNEELAQQLPELQRKKAAETEKLEVLRQECEQRRSRVHTQKEVVANVGLNLERLILCVGATVPNSLSEETKDRLRGDAKQFGEGLKGLRADLSSGVEKLCQTSAEAERAVADTKMHKAKQDADAETHTISLEIEKHQHAAERKMKNLSMTLSALKEDENKLTKSHLEKLRRAEDLKESLESKLENVENDMEEMEEEVERRMVELQEFEEDASVELNEQRLKQERPLKQALAECEPEVRALRKRMRSELSQRDRFWSQQLKKVEQDWSASSKAKEKQILDEIEQLQKKN